MTDIDHATAIDEASTILNNRLRAASDDGLRVDVEASCSPSFGGFITRVEMNVYRPVPAETTP